jgi:hypothetical protein
VIPGNDRQQSGDEMLTLVSPARSLPICLMKLRAAQINKSFEQRDGCLLTVRQLAAALEVPPTTIYYWVESLGLEPSFRACARGRMYFLLADVLTWLSRHRKIIDIAEWRRAA